MKIPRLVAHDVPSDKPTSFAELNDHRDKYADARSITWPYTSLTHLPDDDTLTENPPALLDQARTIRAFAPHATLRVAPIRLEAYGTTPDPRRDTPIAEAWAAEVIRATALAGVDEAEFDLGPPPKGGVVDYLSGMPGAQVVPAEPVPAPGTLAAASAVQAFAVRSTGGYVVWLINRTPRKASVVVEGLGRPARVWPLGLRPDQPPAADPHATTTQVELAPYAVVRVVPD